MMKFNLELLRKVTGVFISRADFEVILIRYKECMEELDFEDTPENALQFCEEWKEEQELIGTFATTKEGTFKYYVSDGVGDDAEKITMQELLDKFDENKFCWETKCREMWKKIHKLMNSSEIEKYQFEDLLGEETLGYEQIWSLQAAMMNRIGELLSR